MRRKYDWRRSRSLIVMLSLCMGMGSVVSPAAVAMASTVQSEDAAIKSVTQKAPDFPAVYPDYALKKLSDAEVSKRVEGLIKAMTQDEKFDLLGGDGTNNSSTKGYGGERSYGTISEMESPYDALSDRMDDVTGVVGIDQIGETIPNEYLYVSTNSISANEGVPEHGAVRTYGVKSEGSSGTAFQGQTWGAASASTTLMEVDGEFKIGEVAAYDDEINFNTGTGRTQDNWWHNGEDGTAFPQKSQRTSGIHYSEGR